MAQLNDLGFKMIASFEGCKLKAYRDSANITTIGYGHIRNDDGSRIRPDQTCTQQEADEWFKDDLHSVASHFIDCWLPQLVLNDDQYSALTSFIFNLGCGTFRKSTVFNCLHRDNLAMAADAFLQYDHAGGAPIAGLTRRRNAERALFLSDYEALKMFLK